jgi:hypothetical protein
MHRLDIISLADPSAVCGRIRNDVEGDDASRLSHVHPRHTVIRLDESRTLLKIQH